MRPKISKTMWMLLPTLFLSSEARAVLLYERVTQYATTADLEEAAWHPSGRYALVLASDGKVLRYTRETDAVEVAAELSGVTFHRLEFSADGTEAVIAAEYHSGNTNDGRLYRFTDATGAVAEIEGARKPAVFFRGVDFKPGSDAALVAGYQSAPEVLYAFEYVKGSSELSLKKAVSVSGGPTDASWSPDAEYALITIGMNNARVYTYRPAAVGNELLDANYTSAFGSNPAAVDFRPAGAPFGIVVDWVANVHAYDGSWRSVKPLSNYGLGFNNVEWNETGTRALIVGRPRSSGGPLAGTVVQFTGADASQLTRAYFTDESIPGFDSNPYNADGNAHLLAAAWRPGCNEGIIAGAKGRLGGNQFGMLIRFVDSEGAACGGRPDAGVVDAGTPDSGSPDASVAAGDGGDISDAGAAFPDAGAAFPDAATIPRDAGDAGGGVSDEGGAMDSGRVTKDGGAPADASGPDADETAGQPDASTGPAESCSTDRDCRHGYYCRRGQCDFDCRDNTNCPLGSVCNDYGKCELAAPAKSGASEGCSCSASGAPLAPLLIPAALLLAVRKRRKRYFKSSSL